MCKAKDVGPRCSSNGRLRIERSNKNMARVLATRDRELATKGEVSEKTLKRLDNAERRAFQAEKVYRSTPKGQAELQDSINVEEQRLSNLKKGTKEFNSTKRKIGKLNRKLETGQKDREIAYANGRILEDGEKKLVRNKMQYQGAPINNRSQKASPQVVAEQKDASKDVPLELREWNREELKPLANHWVEEGTRTGWVDNKNARPSKELAKATKVQPTTSNMFRMNTPDGMVAEQRTDIHTLKGENGKFYVEVRRTSAATNLQSSPIDTNGAEVGEIISSKKGVMERRVELERHEFKSEKEAVAFTKKSRNRISQTAALDLAVTTRQSLVKWASKGNGQESLYKAPQPGQHLYSADPNKPVNA